MKPDRRDVPNAVGSVVMNLPYYSLKSLEQLHAAIQAEIRSIDKDEV